ncbi:MAG: ABC transporter permease [Thermoplasmata archaeon]
MTLATSTANINAVPQQGHAVQAFGLIGWRWISRNPAAAVAPILLPFIFLYFLSLISPPGLLPLEIIGAMLFTTQNIGNWVLGDSATWRIQLNLQEMFIASPLGKVRYLFGVAFSNMIAAAPALAILMALLVYVRSSEGHPIPLFFWPLLVLAILFLWILFSAVGIAISSRVKSQREVWPVGNLSFTVLGMLSPLYYPLSYLPPWWQTLAHFLPATYAALLAQGALGITPQSGTSLFVDALLLVLLSLVGTAVALRLYKWREA